MNLIQHHDDTCHLCRFDADLNAAKDESSSEVQAKEKLAREKEQLQNDLSEFKEKVKVCEIKREQIGFSAYVYS